MFAEARERERGTAEATRKTTDGEAQTGAMIALFLPTESAERLAIPGGEPADSLHITLAYLGKAADWAPAQVRRLRHALAGWASEQEPLSGRTTGGVGTFPTSEDGEYPLYARVDVPGLTRFRERLVRLLDAQGFYYDQTHPDFRPHVTLDWVPDGKEPPVSSVAEVPLAFPHLTLVVGGDRYAVAVGDEQYPAQHEAAKAEAAGVSARLEQVSAAMTLLEMRDLRARLLAELGVAS